jgi:hypothetical protein
LNAIWAEVDEITFGATLDQRADFTGGLCADIACLSFGGHELFLSLFEEPFFGTQLFYEMSLEV